MHRLLGVTLVAALAVSACTSDEPPSPNTIEQDGTSAQDVEVAVLRERFRADPCNPSFGECSRFKGAVPYGLQRRNDSTGYYSFTTPLTSKKRKWSCVERDAKKDSPQQATNVAYELFTDADEVRMTNEGSGFGKTFVWKDDELFGYPVTNIPGSFVTHDIARVQAGVTADGKESSTLVMERVTRVATAAITPADETALAMLRESYEPAVSYPDGVAIAYVYCATFADVAN